MTKGKILIVDDCSMNIELLQETLAPFEYEILTYTNPFEALEKERHSHIDIALIDIIMPGLDGFRFAEEFVKSHKNTPIVYVSAHGENENKIKGYNSGSFVYIEKPFDVKTVRAQIQSILKLKEVQDELLNEKEKLDNIFEFSSNEIILTDINFNIISQNNKILKQNKNYVSDNFLNILDTMRQDEALKELKNFVKLKNRHTQFRFIPEENIYTKATVSKIYSNNNHTGYLIILDDITEEIEKQNMREYFIEMLTHDLKTPVRAEKRALELLLEDSFGELKEEQREIIQEILNSSDYMLRMTDNILTRYKIDNGELKITKSNNSIKKTLEFCIENLKHQIEAKNQTLIINSLLKDEDTIFEYDDIAMRRILLNIISNASEYSPTGSKISISVEKKLNNIEVSIQDEGSGIPEEEIANIYAKKIQGTKRFRKVGSGLGLFITRKLIEAHDGTIEITTKQINNKGTNFTIFLPVKKSKKRTLVQI